MARRSWNRFASGLLAQHLAGTLIETENLPRLLTRFLCRIAVLATFGIPFKPIRFP
jgi:hypothetical protein